MRAHRIGGKRAIVLGLVVQAAATVPLAFLDELSGWLIILLVATFAGGVANLVAIVGFMVAVTAGVPDREQGSATGLAAMSQQIGITVGTPVMSAIVAAVGHTAVNAELVHGISTALVLNAAICLGAAAVIAVAIPGVRTVTV